jgi:D-threo-aldose 1-dehydrogenase
LDWSTRPSPGAGLGISRLSLGTSSWRDALARPDSGADPAAVLAAVFAGSTAPQLTVVDTSNNYGDGESERIIGRAIRDAGGLPSGVLVASKLDRDPTTGDFGADRMRASLSESLDRLGLTSLPLLYLHDPEDIGYEEAFAADGPVAALVAMKREGLAAAIGISGGPAVMLLRYLETGLFDAVITHNRFTLVDRSAEVFLDYAAGRGIQVFNAAPYGSAPLAKWPAPATHYAYRPAAPEVAAAIAAMGRSTEVVGVPLAAAALQFSLRDERVASTVVGINSVRQLESTMALAETHVPESLWTELEALRPASAHWQDPPGPSPWNQFPTHLMERFSL